MTADNERRLLKLHLTDFYYCRVLFANVTVRRVLFLCNFENGRYTNKHIDSEQYVLMLKV